MIQLLALFGFLECIRMLMLIMTRNVRQLETEQPAKQFLLVFPDRTITISRFTDVQATAPCLLYRAEEEWSTTCSELESKFELLSLGLKYARQGSSSRPSGLHTFHTSQLASFRPDISSRWLSNRPIRLRDYYLLGLSIGAVTACMDS